MQVKIINRSPFSLPEYATPGSSGMDIRAHLDQALTLAPMARALVPTGLYLELPQGLEAQLRPRSGLAAKHGITLLNAPGTIDQDYHGEIKVILVNLSQENFTVQPGDRIAQMVICRFEHIEWLATGQISDSERGSGGFGSTGLS